MPENLMRDSPAGDLLHCGGTATGTAAPLLTLWTANTVVVAGQVRRTAGGRVVKYAGPGTTLGSGSGPTTTGYLVDGTAPCFVYGGSAFHDILIESLDTTNGLFVGAGAQITAGGDLSASFAPAGAGLSERAGTDVTGLYTITAGASVAYCVSLVVV